MELEVVYDVCRLCLAKPELKYSLLASTLVEKLQSLALLEVKEDDQLPTFCCETCLGNICKFYKFKQDILQSDKTLRDRLCKVETEPNVLELAKESPELFEVLHIHDDHSSLIKPKIEYNINVENRFDFFQHDISIKSEAETSFKVEVTEDCLDMGIELKDELNDEYTGMIGKQTATLTCEKCNKKFPTRRRFSRHMQGHKVEMCPVCTLVIRRDNLKKHIEMHGSPHEICDVCGKVAKNRESLRGHIYYTHREIDKQIKCEYCSKEFKHNNHYQAHVRNVHLEIRNQQCHLCGKKFTNGYALRKHIKMTHECARPHICQYCKKGFSSPYALKTHVRQHTHETPYPCDLCGQAFRQKVSLVTHLKSKHSVIPHKKQDKFESVEIEQSA